MPLGVRIFLVYFLFVGLTGYFVLSTVMDEVRPGVRQSTEETLVDTANLLAEILRQDVKNGTLAQSDLPEMLEDYGKRVPQADIWGLRKEAVNHRIYVTDASGKVLLDSAGVAVGQDYSRWNDVYLTLRGQYGARSSREDPDDPDSSVMYVAAPIKDGYVERYVHTLTHELKSPLAAIRGAAELLDGEMPAEQRARFVGNIAGESERLQQLIERLLSLAQVEQRQGLEEVGKVDLREIAASLLEGQAARIQRQRLRVENRLEGPCEVRGEQFLLRQALANLLDNALDFTPPGGILRLLAEVDGEGIALRLFNQGPAIPDYALARLTERFYSLPRPASGRKSTGLGLNFVAEVAQLHGGRLQVGNRDDGVEALLWLPRG
ncbi:sensor histidine kinase [Pseudomonas aeruginosa]|uniref:sensor histidine kinase n=1 Tax=Pseudomonas aeruginosa TaxID=287 RepID=UPI00104CE5A0|nr:sensor histidine kinase [Pseudomonas aeruginosa]